MQRRLLLDGKLLQITLNRLCQQLIENHDTFNHSLLIGLQPRGVFLADRLYESLKKLKVNNVKLGYLDTTFHRDDFRRREKPLQANKTDIPFLLENKKVILIDDVIYRGRLVRSALNAIAAFGRPSSVELLVLVDRLYSREFPIEANYVGLRVNTMATQQVVVKWGKKSIENSIWIENAPECQN